MTRFTFPLEAALQQRVRQEQAVQVELARAALEHDAALERLDALQQERATIGYTTVGAGASVDVEARMNTLYYADRCALLVDEQTRVVRAHEGEIERVRGLLVEAAARRRALERLREKRRCDYEARLNRLLESQLDELVTVRHTAARHEEQTDADY